MRSLRARLTAVYATSLLAGLLLFSAISLVILDRTQHSTLDQRLRADLHASAALVEVRGQRPVLDTEDRKQFAAAMGVNGDGAVLSTDNRPVMTTALTIPPQISAFALRAPERAQIATIAANGGDVRVMTLPILRGGKAYGVIVVWRAIEDIEDFERTAALIFGIAIPILLGFAMLFGGVVAQRGLTPIRDLAALTSEIEAHDLSRRLHISYRDSELAALGRSFNRMLDRLQAAFRRQHRFTTDVSHELRGPIAVIHAEAELALRRERTTAEYERVLATILTETDHVTTLVNELLAAARNDTPASAGLCDLTAAVQHACDRLTTLAESRRIIFNRELEDAVSVLADPTSLRQLLFAILHNAVKFSSEGRPVSVHLSREGNTAALSVRDHGPGFSASALQHAFERFWRDERLPRAAGSGLGLAIAREIVERMNGKIRAHNDPQGGAVVDLTLPLAPSNAASDRQDSKRFATAKESTD